MLPVPSLTIGTSRNYDGDDNGNVKKAVGLMNKITTLHVAHFSTYFSFPLATT